MPLPKHSHRFCCGIALLLATFVPAMAAADSWQAGVAKTKITPSEPMWMSGYASRDRPAEGTLIDLWAKALVLQDPAGVRAVAVTLDLVGIDRELAQSIRQALHDSFQLATHQVVLCSSHTHTGPALQRNLAPMHYALVDPAQQQRIERYTDKLPGHIVDVVRDALSDLAPCQLTWGEGHTSLAVNRRENREEESVPALRRTDSLKGPVDHSVPVLAVRGKDNSLRAILFGYACHATVLSDFRWSGDYPGFAQLELEQNHPGCIALFWAGCGADQNPIPRRSVELARHYGRELAVAVDSLLLTTQMQEIEGALATSYAEINLPFAELPSGEQLAIDAKSPDRYVASRARTLQQQLLARGSLDSSYPYPIAVWKLGNKLDWVLLGGEVVVDYALRLKLEIPTHTWIAAYTNDVMAYIPSRRVLLEGGYEGGGAMVYYGLPSRWANDIEERIVNQVARQVGQ